MSGVLDFLDKLLGALVAVDQIERAWGWLRSKLRR